MDTVTEHGSPSESPLSVFSGDGRRRFATAEGIAFEAKPTEDGTWHGYPVPWEAVPSEIVRQWKEGGEVSRRQIREHWSKDQDDLHWAIEKGAR